MHPVMHSLCCLAGFYKGRIAEAIISAIRSRGGVMTHEDLTTHRSMFTRPISTTYRGLRVYETPPPTQVSSMDHIGYSTLKIAALTGCQHVLQGCSNSALSSHALQLVALDHSRCNVPHKHGY